MNSLPEAFIANPEPAKHVTLKSLTLADDEITYTLTPRSIKIKDENGHIEVEHGSYFPLPSEANWRDYVLSGAIYEQMGAGGNGERSGLRFLFPFIAQSRKYWNLFQELFLI